MGGLIATYGGAVTESLPKADVVRLTELVFSRELKRRRLRIKFISGRGFDISSRAKRGRCVRTSS